MSELLSVLKTPSTSSTTQQASATAAPHAAVSDSSAVDVAVGLLVVMGSIYAITLVERHWRR